MQKCLSFNIWDAVFVTLGKEYDFMQPGNLCILFVSLENSEFFCVVCIIYGKLTKIEVKNDCFSRQGCRLVTHKN